MNHVALPLLMWLSERPLTEPMEPHLIRSLRRSYRSCARLAQTSRCLLEASSLFSQNQYRQWSRESEEKLLIDLVEEARRWYDAVHDMLDAELGGHILSCIFDGGLGLNDDDVDEIRDLASGARPLAPRLWRALLGDRAQYVRVLQASSSPPMHEMFFEARDDLLLYRIRALHEILDLPIEEETALQLHWDKLPDFAEE